MKGKGFEYGEAKVGAFTLRAWYFAKESEADVEVWSGEEYVTTVTIPLGSR